MTVSRYVFGATATFAVAALFVLTLAHAPAGAYSSGAPAAFSGPEQICNACHGGPGNVPNTGTGFVSILAPDTFSAGETVPITVSLYNTTPLIGPDPIQGFQLSARDDTLANVGTFTVDGTTVQYAQGVEAYVTHTAASNQDTSWTFSWTAPMDAPPTVTLYVAGNASNADGIPDDDDEIYTDSLVMTRATTASEPSAVPLALELGAAFPNPFRDATVATYTLARPARVAVELRDGRGRTLRVVDEGAREAGTHTVRIAAEGLAAGTYFLTVRTPEGTRTQLLTRTR